MSQLPGLRRWRPGRRLPPAPADAADGLRALLAIADRAVTIQRATDEVVRACGQPGEVPRAVARAGGPLVTEYWRLGQEAVDLRLAPPLEPLRDRLTRLLEYHQLMAHHALRFAFSVGPNPRRDAARGRLSGLGRSGQALRELRAGLAAAVDPAGHRAQS